MPDIVHRWIPYTLLVLLLCCPAAVLAQQMEASGYVRDKNNRPVAHCSVLVLSRPDSIIRAFAATDASGFYKVKWNGSLPVLIRISRVGYKHNITELAGNGLVLQHSLEDDAGVYLNEIIVRAPPKISVSGDTTSYKLGAFTNGGEKVLEDALAKLPGFNIDEDGRIKINGRPVQKILVEGDDLVGDKYTMLSKNLSPDMIEQVQVVDNYLDDPFLRTVEKTDDIAINLNFKNEFRNVLLTDAQLEGGTPKRYNAVVNNVLLGKRTKLYGLTSLNNTGRDLSVNNGEYIPKSSIAKPFDPQIASRTIVDLSPGSIPYIEKNRWLNNHSSLFSINLLYRISQKVNVKVNAGFAANKTRQEIASQSIYYIPDSSAISYDELQQWQSKDRQFNGRMQVDYSLKPGQRIRYIFDANFLNLRDETITFFNQAPLAQRLKNSASYLKNSLNYVARFRDRNFLVIDAAHVINKLPQEYRINGYDYGPVFGQGKVNAVHQYSNNPIEYLGGQARYYFNVPNGQLVAIFGYDHNKSELRSSFKPYHLLPEEGMSINNELFLITEKVFGEMDYQYKLSGKLEMTGRIGLNYLYNNKRYLPSNKPIAAGSTVFASPEISLRFTQQKHKLILSYAWYKESPEASTLYDSLIFVSYRSAAVYNDSLFFRTVQKYSLNYRYSNPYRQLSIYGNVFYSLTDNGYASDNVVTANYNVTRKYPIEGGYRLAGLLYGIDRYVPPLSTAIKFNGSVLLNMMENTVNDSERRRIRNWNMNNKLSFVSVFNGFFNFVAAGQYNRSAYIASTPENTVRRASFYTKLLLQTNYRIEKDLYLQVSGSRFQWSDNTHVQQPVVFVDAHLKKELLEGRLSLSLSLQHALNSGMVTLNYVSDYYQHNVTNRLLPRMVLFGGKYTFR